MVKLLNTIECDWRLRVPIAVIGGIILGIFGERLYSDIVVDHRQPINSVIVSIKNSPIRVGEWLGVRVIRNKVRSDCPTVNSIRSVTNENGRHFNIPDQLHEGGSPDKPYVDLDIDTTQLPKGHYTLHITAEYICNSNTQFFRVLLPAVSFIVRTQK